jgi:hypothetical protein
MSLAAGGPGWCGIFIHDTRSFGRTEQAGDDRGSAHLVKLPLASQPDEAKKRVSGFVEHDTACRAAGGPFRRANYQMEISGKAPQQGWMHGGTLGL